MCADFQDNGCDCWPLRLVCMSLHLYCYVWRTEGINQNASSLTAEKCLFLVSEAHVFICVWWWSSGSHQPRREKMFFFLIWQPFQICIHQWLLLSTSDLMLPITVHVFKPQNRLYWQIQSTQATSTYKYHILKTFFVYSTRLKTTACGFTKDKCWRLQEITAQEETCA